MDVSIVAAHKIQILKCTMSHKSKICSKEISNLTQSQVELRKENRGRDIVFSASLMQSNSGYVGPFTTEITLTYRNVLTNIGNAYNPITGVFTAPLKGAYRFRVSVFGHGNPSNAAYVSIMKNEGKVVMAYARQDQRNINSSNGVVLILEVGDVVHASLGGLALDKASHFISKAVDLVCLDLGKSGLKVSAKEMVKDIGTIGMRAAAKAGSRALGVIGLGMSLYDLIATCEEIIKGNQVTESSKFLHDSAREILEGRRKLKEQLDTMHEIIRKLLQLQKLVKDLGGYSLSMTEDGQKIINYIIGTCTDNSVISWLQSKTHQIEFTNVLRFYQESGILEDLHKHRERHIHIVFVAHGRIVAEFMPAGGLVPVPIIRDTILYSPWNCKIDGSAAYSVAQGSINMSNRTFSSLPNPFPNRWNSMRESRYNIPGIILSPFVPEEQAWTYFQVLWRQRTMEIDGRVIIPYLVRQNLVNAFGEIPFCVFLFAASFMPCLFEGTATVHLAACLDRAGSPLMPVEWRTQYAYTNDGAFMSVNMDQRNVNPGLFRAFRSLFDRHHR
ncbi:complement C1q 2 isoform X2 [Labeo rohita]|uniref:Complement C1q 2 isoform X2 n=1 Tax=Labeo rohita TaxID=84645 RepID=A0A498M0Y3_LABRO|nr:complement C1q 2 isoform X2 [Labeo rohita]